MARQRKHPGRKAETSSLLSSLSPGQQDLLSLLFLFVLTLILFRGIVFTNGAFSTGGDTAAAAAFHHAGETIQETEGVDPQWMPYFFSGMPTFGNVAYVPHDVSYVQYVGLTILKLLYLNSTWGWIVVFYFLEGVFMFFLARELKTSRVAALFAAVAFMLSPYGIGLAPDGHGSKLMALSYWPMVMLLTHQMFERRTLLSFGLLAAGIGTLFLTNHLQMVYYALVILGFYTVYQLVVDMRMDRGVIVPKLALMAGALLIGAAISSYVYLSVYEYANYSIRGSGAAGTSGGLTWQYATDWSWHPQELLTLLIPGFFGFQGQLYWGTMPFTNSTVYFGILPILLSILALVYRRNSLTIFFALLALLALLVSFGKHFPLYGLLFQYLPFFNKFRVPVMALHVLPFTAALLSAYGVDFLLEARANGAFSGERLRKVLLVVAGLLGLLLLVCLFMKSSLFTAMSGSMFQREDQTAWIQRQYGAQGQAAILQLQRQRFDMLWGDFVRFVIIAIASIGAILLALRKTVSAGTFSILIMGILLTDLVLVINKGHFIDPKPAAQLDQQFLPDQTVRFLQEQPGQFRILPLGDLYQDNTFAYHGLQSMYGYHPAKLKIYQTMLDSCLTRTPDPSFPYNMNVINMLNVRYIVVGAQLPADKFTLVNVDQQNRLATFENPAAAPRAFFASSVRTFKDPIELLHTMNTTEFVPAQTAFLEEPLEESVSRPDSSTVEITEYRAHTITLSAYTSSRALLVLSEIYYPPGWHATIDDVEVPVHKTDYVLRSVVVPAGKHEIRFHYASLMYSLGYTITNVAWGVTILCILAGLWQIPAVRNRVKVTPREHES